MYGKNKIGVTVITGFLGAGKTTFINQVLKQHQNRQFALVENEFGEVSIDTTIVKGVDASRMFELKNGCICCTISGEYDLVLAELAERFPNIDNLLIETTGLADPAQVAMPFFKNEKLKEIFTFNGTICIVDAINFQSQLKEEVAVKQVASADMILISKVEKVSGYKAEKIKNSVAKINPACKVILPVNGLSTEYNPDEKIYQPGFLPDLPSNRLLHSGIHSKTFTFNHLLEKDDFVQRLSYNLDVYKSKVYRIKGILCFRNEIYEYILQGVGGSFEITESDNIANQPYTRIVVIGKEIGDFQLF